MLQDNRIIVGRNDAGELISLLPRMANRHGLVAGATGTGKTVTLKVLAEAFSDLGVPVFMADVKGDVAGMALPGENTENMQGRIRRFGLAEMGFTFQGYPVTLWDIYGKNGIQLRTTISEMGPLLLARVLGLNDLQSDILAVIFKIADDNNLLLVDTKDLKSLLNFVDDNSGLFAADYGKISSSSIGVIMRSIVALESVGGDLFFGEPALNINDWLLANADGKGVISILDSSSLINNGKMYSAFLLWLLSELFEELPEVGDLDKPKLVFFFDEAHLLFNDAPKALLDKIELLVKLIRSKGVGVYFCTQNPKDVPDSVLAQLSNKIEHGLRAYTPADQRAVRAAADSFRVNAEFDTYEAILSLGTGEAIVSFLQADGVPGVAEKISVFPPQSNMGSLPDDIRAIKIRTTPLYVKYAESYDPDSAYEFLQRKGVEDAEMAARAAEEAARAKEAEKEALAAQREAERIAAAEAKAAEKAAEAERKAAEKAAEAERREYERQERERQRQAERVASSAGGTVGREVGKSIGGAIAGDFGRKIGGNIGATLGRGFFGNFFRK
ncbi:MAG: DUF853 family protein [Mogibacterium sp.]|nr:DUF853 family protein [Mogibacterium sp.]